MESACTSSTSVERAVEKAAASRSMALRGAARSANPSSTLPLLEDRLGLVGLASKERVLAKSDLRPRGRGFLLVFGEAPS